MKRYAAHYVFLGNEKIYKLHYLELDENACLTGVYPLDAEIAGTVFHNGILFPVSVEMKFSSSIFIDELKRISQLYPEDLIFQLLDRLNIICENQNPVRILQLDGIDLITLSLRHHPPMLRFI